MGYRWRPVPEAVAADLGIQAAGGVAVPLVEGHEAALPRLERWLAVGGEGPAEGVEAPRVERPATSSDLPEEDRAAAGGALVRRAETWERWGERELASAAALLTTETGRSLVGSSRNPARPIAVVAGDLAAAPERAWLAWTLAAGAALVLPGDPAFAAWAIYWPRPTDVALPADHLALVRVALASLGRPRAARRRLERLRRLLVWGEVPPADEVRAWGELGVTLTPFPALK